MTSPCGRGSARSCWARAAVGLPRRRRTLRGDARRGRVAARGGPRAARARPRPARPARGAMRRSGPRRAFPAGAAPLLRGAVSRGWRRPAAARHVGADRSRKGPQVGRWPALGRRRSSPWSLSDSARRSPASAAARRVVVAQCACARDVAGGGERGRRQRVLSSTASQNHIRAWPGNGVGWVVELTPRAGLQPRARSQPKRKRAPRRGAEQ